MGDLDLHSKSQLHEKPKTFVSIFSQIEVLVCMKFSMLSQAAFFVVEAHAEFILHKNYSR